jgi:hypothetical protein
MPVDTDRALLRERFGAQLQQYERVATPLIGLANPATRHCFVEQLVDSARRVAYPTVLLARKMGDAVADPRSTTFDPLRAAIHNIQIQNEEESFWLIFLFVHFGKSITSEWRLVRDCYAGPNGDPPWTWRRVSAPSSAFGVWLTDQAQQWTADGIKRHFGNHRKYESIKSTGQVVSSYVEWVTEAGSHKELIKTALVHGKGPGGAFDYLYRSMSAVHRFGRTARFDYLSMLAKLRLAPIRAGSGYLSGATGPLTGARLLFAGSKEAELSASQLEVLLVALGDALDAGQQELEDAICNWQKSPSRYRHFRG